MQANANRALWWTLALMWAGLIFWLSSSPDAQGAFWLIEVMPYGDKFAHAFAFGVLAFCVHMASGKWWLALGLSSLYGMSDELHQSFVPGRRVGFSDWIADTLGAVGAVLLVKFLTRAKKR